MGSASSDESGEENYELRKDKKRKPRTESERAAVKVFLFSVYNVSHAVDGLMTINCF